MDHVEDLGVLDGRIILICMLKIGCEEVDWVNIHQDKGPVAGCCEHGTEHASSMLTHNFQMGHPRVYIYIYIFSQLQPFC